MSIFSYCPFPPHPHWCVPDAVLTLLLGTLSHAGAPPSPSSLLQWPTTPAKRLWCFISILSPIYLTLILRKMPLAIKSWIYVLGFLVSIGRRQRIEPFALLLSNLHESTRGLICVAITFVFPSLWGSVYGCVCGYLCMYPALMNVWTGGSYYRGGVLNNKVYLAWSI